MELKHSAFCGVMYTRCGVEAQRVLWGDHASTMSMSMGSILLFQGSEAHTHRRTHTHQEAAGAA